MPSTVERLTKRGLITPPNFIVSNTMYETVMGSVAYGVSDDLSDRDTLGFCIPPKDMVFPHLAGEIPGFGRHKQRFDCYQKHHVLHPDEQIEYDLNIYSIVKYFFLCMENNPNMIDSLYTPRECVMHCTEVGNMVRDSRDLFLHKGAWHRFKGYAYSQLHKMRSKEVEPGSKRDKIRQRYGYDVKFAYHTVRLLYEAEMILTEGTIDLRRNREHLKAIRRGEVTQEDVIKWASDKEAALERAYETSQLQHSPNENVLKQLLLDCLEHHYGSLKATIIRDGAAVAALRQIQAIVERTL
jgi:predicted nucleotidyltransferase